jgi:hypothetical protein
MPWPAAANFAKTNVDAGTDSPAIARSDIHQLMVDVEDMIDARDEADGVAPLDADGKLPAANLPLTPFCNGVVVFGTGSGNWTVPDNVTKVRAWAVGAGGGGGFVSAGTAGDHGGGGGAGAVIMKVLTVVPGTDIAYSAGSHGVGKANSGDGDGTAGGNTTFTTPASATPASTTFTANGGDKGYGPGGATDRVGGAGGNFSTAPSGGQQDLGIQGGAGASGATRGGMGGANMFSGGVAGATGYGGGGGFGSGGTASAFDGLDGFVMFEW